MNYPLTGVSRFRVLLPGLAALLAFIITVFLSSCVVPLDSVNAMSGRSIEVAALDKWVEPPIPGKSPVQASRDPGSYTIDFFWYDTQGTPDAADDGEKLSLTDTFKEGRTYRVVLELSPSPGFTFADPAADAEKFKDFDYSGGGEITVAEPLTGRNGIRIEILFEPVG
jgi:hypothetical protein